MPRHRFPPFEADPDSGELWRDGVVVPLQDLPFRLLVLLLERRGEVVTRDEIAERLWGKDTFVDAGAGVNTAIAKLREALGDTAGAPRFIETLPKRGYRFVGHLEEVPVAVASRAQAVPIPTPSAPPAPRRIGLVTLVAVALVALLGWSWIATRRVPEAGERVAVILFDNETEDPAWNRPAQNLTDATVEALTRLEGLDVVGNAAILRTPRPFRDLGQVQRELAARWVVIGQVQRVDAAIVVRCHLIRTSDQAHVWFESFPAGTSEGELLGRVAAGVAGAVGKHREAD
jgi:DNA-binding winged helix-turn-helix (wHTH) protein/TolB-like protein